jgi:hypothetical protein
MQWKLAEIFAVVDQDVEGVGLDFVVVFAAVQSIEVGTPSTPSRTGA